jgi:hypothetical protein
MNLDLLLESSVPIHIWKLCCDKTLVKVEFIIILFLRLLLRGGIAQGVPSLATIFLSIVRSPSKFSSFLIHPPELSVSDQQKRLVAKQREINDRKLCRRSISFIFCRLFLTCSKIFRHGPTDLLLLRRKACYGFLSPFKIHRNRPGLNPQTLGPPAYTITTIPPRPAQSISLQYESE